MVGCKRSNLPPPPKLAFLRLTFLRRRAALFAAMAAQEQKGHLAR